ncbi:MAG: NBR1-Ig-like domain-containing protein [Anaerolineae bacterium]
MVSIPWRTGVNMREFAYYGQSGLPNFFAPAALQRQQLETLRSMGVKLVRFFASQRSINSADAAARVRAACDLLQQYGMQGIICLDDGLGAAGWFVPGTDSLHSEVLGHYHKRFFTEGLYRTTYLPHVTTIVTAVKDHPGALMFELGNEYAFHPRNPEPNRQDAQAFINFARDVSTAIKQIAPTKLVSTGLVNSRHVANLIDEVPPVTFSRQLHSLPTIDVISLHYYFQDNEKGNLATDVGIAKQLGKPFYVGELGAEFGVTDRMAYYRAELQDWKTQGAFTALPWAFDSSPNDVGVSDIYSFSRIKGDFDGLRSVVQSFAAEVPPFSLTVEPAPIGTGSSASGSSSVTTGVNDTKVPSRATGTLTAVSGTFSDTNPAFMIQLPMTWPYNIRARFNDPAGYTGVRVPRREGILFAPQTATTGLPVRAVQRGRVSLIKEYPPGYGRYVCIEHKWYGETYVSWYGHLDQINVQLNDYVNAGQQIGTAGRTGSADEISLFLTLQWLGKGNKGYVVDDVIDPTPLMAQSLPPRDEVWFDAHVTAPDNTVFQPGAIFKKTWRVRNAGNTVWQNYHLTYFSGDPMGPNRDVIVPTVQPGDLAQISVDLTAPQTIGTQRSTWALRNASGQLFRSELTTQITVQGRDQGTRTSLARFVSDITIPDGMPVLPNTRFTKTWRIMNDGNTVWDGGFRLTYESGERMSAPDFITLPALRPRQVGDVSVDLVAPAAAGRYRVTFQPIDSDGKPFDFEMYAEIVVDPTLGQQKPPNDQTVFASPAGGRYTIGWKFMAPVPYGDGKHKGVDYVSATTGNPIFASGDGIVFSAERCGICTPDRPNFASQGLTIEAATNQGIFSRPSQWNFGFGNLIIVRYAFNALPTRARDALNQRGFTNGYAFVFYAHLLDIFVNANQTVTAGTQIGTMGNSGNSTGPHLHLEVRLGKNTTDYSRPIQLLDPELMFSL